ncbi:hypothetical protein QQG09_08660 [Melissococcus plutonius]|uniref:hypothetical protein n=1 Tax=Melissococcus plutonius TaxID=33970 RepID=UPI00065F28B8|nr:hypothetical protein [Melissococcus plutonius]AIM25790.1 hypothetical protein MEPL_c010570 [Melissococcus plutonius S1]KMT23488.1 hypothetical protein MEPL2_43p00700 [Melissococcus plutonius]KMT25246.1 hypothetical protein MEPL2_2c08040 [Melissococcus plutonius]KMT26152.1 hypothetical protein MEPL3_3c00770 [Melissococcus plutonius]KMT26882.1 hypothetical protein MEPL1_4c00770 [Melissococcus plutonius]
MNEHDNVRDVLLELIELAEATKMITNGHSTTVEELQELFVERLCNLADLLGMSDVYL